MTDVPAHSTITVSVHGTPPEIWDVLARVFTPQTGDRSTWITLKRDDTEVHFFGPRRDA